MDKRIREAAENDIQTYQEKDWSGMEVLLDKHLPQKKRRRGIIVFFLLAALTATGYLLVDSVSSSRRTVAQEGEVSAPETNSRTNSATNKTADKINPVGQGTNNNNNNDKRTVVPYNENTISKQQQKELPSVAIPKEKINSTVTRKNNNIPNTAGINSDLSSKKDLTKQAAPPKSAAINKNGLISPATPGIKDKDIAAPATDKQQTLPSTYPATAQNDKVIIQQPDVPVAENKETKPEEVAATNKPVKKERSPKSFINRLSLTASAGPDYSSVKFKYAGQVRLNYGIGLSYAINDRFSLRTGFYAGSKDYSADSNSYKTYSTSGTYSSKLQGIEADCYVFEVPVSLAYNFKTTKDHNWFASAGLSSYFMKKEDYLYTFISPTGQKYSHLYEFRNENKHPFSVVSLSAGYQHKFSNRFSLSAEPYVKLPLGGVGEGRVMLNNTGVLFTAAWKPFGRK